jgi:hypothetical protein
MNRAARTLIAVVAIVGAAIAAPTTFASSPGSATLTILDASCSGAPGTISTGMTVCARAVVTSVATGSEPYRTYWYGPGAFSPTFQDVHAMTGAATDTFQDSHQLDAAGTWTVRACKNSTCVTASSIMASKAFTVRAATGPAPTTLIVAAASGTFGGSTDLSATLVTTSGGAPVVGANVDFTLPGGSAGSATTDASGVATVTGASLGTTNAGGYPTGVGASFAGGSGMAASTGSASLTVAKAGSTTTVDCPASATFTGDALEPCTASVTGAGLDGPVAVVYQDNVNAGTASAEASFAGDANHDPSNGSATFTVVPAASTVALTCPASVPYTGSAQTPCSASVTGAGGLDQALDVSYANNVLGTATASAAWEGDANHSGTSASATFEITFAWFGFDEPVVPGNRYNPGRTIPLKFTVGVGSGQIVQQLGSPVFSRTQSLGSCDGTPDEATSAASTPDGGSPFKWTGGEYHYNWSTKGLTPGLYRLFAALGDGTVRHVDVCLSK